MAKALFATEPAALSSLRAAKTEPESPLSVNQSTEMRDELRKILWDYETAPDCKNGDIVIFMGYGTAEVSKYITPKPKSAPKDGGDFIFEVCDNDGDDWDEVVLKTVLSQFPEAKDSVNPLLFTCPKVLREKAVFSDVD